jgi:hypothetical protein
MFTGIITGVGRIVAIHRLGSSLDHGKRLTIEAPAGYLDDVGLGDSIALNGACMTVTTLDAGQRRPFDHDEAAVLDQCIGQQRGHAIGRDGTPGRFGGLEQVDRDGLLQPVIRRSRRLGLGQDRPRKQCPAQRDAQALDRSNLHHQSFMQRTLMP